MKFNWKKIVVLVFVAVSLVSVPFLIGANRGTESQADEPLVKVSKETLSPTAQEIQDRNEKMIKRHSDKLTKDMVNMKIAIKNISWGKGQNKTVVRIRYVDGSSDQYLVDNK